LFLVGAIFSGQQGETVRIKIDECVAHYQCAGVIRMIKGEFAVRGAFDSNNSQRADSKIILQAVTKGKFYP